VVANQPSQPLLAAYFARVQLPQLHAFVPIVGGVTFIKELVTASLLFAQFAIVGTTALGRASKFLLALPAEEVRKADLKLDSFGLSAFRQVLTSESPKEVYQRP